MVKSSVSPDEMWLLSNAGKKLHKRTPISKVWSLCGRQLSLYRTGKLDPENTNHEKCKRCLLAESNSRLRVD